MSSDSINSVNKYAVYGRIHRIIIRLGGLVDGDIWEKAPSSHPSDGCKRLEMRCSIPPSKNGWVSSFCEGDTTERATETFWRIFGRGNGNFFWVESWRMETEEWCGKFQGRFHGWDLHGHGRWTTCLLCVAVEFHFYTKFVTSFVRFVLPFGGGFALEYHSGRYPLLKSLWTFNPILWS